MVRKVATVASWTAALAVSVVVAFAQAPSARPSFEVASIKLASPFLQAIRDGSLIGMKIDPGYVRIGHMDLGKLIVTAYGVRRDQIVGPDWLVEPAAPDQLNMFDIEGKLPAGATESQVPLMLQSLLEERFKLIVHKGSRETEGYALVVGKGGLKFSSKQAARTPEGWHDDSLRVSEGAGGVTVHQGASTITRLPGHMRIETSTIAGLVDFLRTQFQVPIIDKTGLSGDFDIKMDVETLRAGDAVVNKDLSDAERLKATIADATQRLQEGCLAAVKMLGLELEHQKISLDTIVVEHVEKTPTQN